MYFYSPGKKSAKITVRSKVLNNSKAESKASKSPAMINRDIAISQAVLILAKRALVRLAWREINRARTHC